jgi:hypothetical protein
MQSLIIVCTLVFGQSLLLLSTYYSSISLSSWPWNNPFFLVSSLILPLQQNIIPLKTLQTCSSFLACLFIVSSPWYIFLMEGEEASTKLRDFFWQHIKLLPLVSPLSNAKTISRVVTSFFLNYSADDVLAFWKLEQMVFLLKFCGHVEIDTNLPLSKFHYKLTPYGRVVWNMFSSIFPF